MLSIIADHYLRNQPKIESFDHLAKKPTERKRKERKKRKEKEKTKGKTKEKLREKGKEKREREREEARQQGGKKEKGHGSKEKEEKSPASHLGQPRAAVAAAVVGNPVSRQNPFFTLF